MSMIFGCIESLNSHDRGMDEARPDGEPDETEMFERVTRCHYKEHAEGRVNADNHQWIVRVTRMPGPAGRPNDHQRVNSGQENHPNQYQRDVQILETIVDGHGFPLFDLA